MRYFAKLSYVGSAYNGWQVQENTPHTVQQVLNERISGLLNEKIEFTGCGRTDTGVHALEFYAHFNSEKPGLDTAEYAYKFNSVVPRDIAIQEILRVKDAAHARYDAMSRTYRYQVIQQRNPFYNERAAFLYAPLDMDRMNEACSVLYEYTDFTSFSKLRTQVKTNLCKVTNAAWKKEGELLVFEITADRFLRNMVRAIVGTMIRIGKQEISREDLRGIIECRNRNKAGESFPAHGLYLVKIIYPPDIFLK